MSSGYPVVYKLGASVLKCEECGSRNAVRYCHECEELFCETCLAQIHSIGCLTSHVLKTTWVYGNIRLRCCVCNDVAARACGDCGVNFCTMCFDSKHRKGTRVKHHQRVLSPHEIILSQTEPTSPAPIQPASSATHDSMGIATAPNVAISSTSSLVSAATTAQNSCSIPPSSPHKVLPSSTDNSSNNNCSSHPNPMSLTQHLIKAKFPFYSNVSFPEDPGPKVSASPVSEAVTRTSTPLTESSRNSAYAGGPALEALEAYMLKRYAAEEDIVAEAKQGGDGKTQDGQCASVNMTALDTNKNESDQVFSSKYYAPYTEDEASPVGSTQGKVDPTLSHDDDDAKDIVLEEASNEPGDFKSPGSVTLPLSPSSSASCIASSPLLPQPRHINALSKASSGASISTPFDYNAMFQSILDMPVNSSSPIGRLAQLAARSVALDALVRRFSTHATQIARMIISELHLPLDQRTYRPREDVGGIAGGLKYVVDSIFFKIAVDAYGLYSGDEFAMKASGLERLSNQQYLLLGHKQIRGPLSTLIDTLGYRVLASAILPIGSNSLVYGSDNQARTMHFDKAECNALVKAAGKILNLKGHYAAENRQQLIYTCADIEVHEGNDGRYYIIDAARLFPCEAPTRSVAAVVIVPDERKVPYVLDCPAKDYLENAAQMIGISPEDMIVTDVPGEGVQAVYSKKLNTQAARQAELERLGSLDDFPTNTSDSQRRIQLNSRLESLQLNRRASLMMERMDGILGPVCFLFKLKGAHLCHLLRPEYVISHNEANLAPILLPSAQDPLALTLPVLLLAGDMYPGVSFLTSSSRSKRLLTQISPSQSSTVANPEQPIVPIWSAVLDKITEQVRGSRTPLSSDAFTRFGTHNARLHNAEVQRATVRLRDHLLPLLISFLANHPASTPCSQAELSAFLKGAGVNMRHLGTMRALIVSVLKSGQGRDAAHQQARLSNISHMILTQMVARVVKNVIRQHLRSLDRGASEVLTLPPTNDDAVRLRVSALVKGTEQCDKVEIGVKEEKKPLSYVGKEELHNRARRCVCSWLNWIVGTPAGYPLQPPRPSIEISHSTTTPSPRPFERFDLTHYDGRDAFLKTHIQVKFGLQRSPLTAAELSSSTPIITLVDRHFILLHVQKKLGLVFSPTLLSKLESDKYWYVSEQPIALADIVSVGAFTRPSYPEESTDAIKSSIFFSYLHHSPRFASLFHSQPKCLISLNDCGCPLPSSDFGSSTHPPQYLPPIAPGLPLSFTRYSTVSPSSGVSLSSVFAEVAALSGYDEVKDLTHIESLQMRIPDVAVRTEREHMQAHYRTLAKSEAVLQPSEIVDILYASEEVALMKQQSNQAGVLAKGISRLTRLAVLAEADCMMDTVERQTSHLSLCLARLGPEWASAAGGMASTTSAITWRLLQPLGFSSLEEAITSTSSARESRHYPYLLKLVELLSSENYVVALVRCALTGSSSRPVRPKQWKVPSSRQGGLVDSPTAIHVTQYVNEMTASQLRTAPQNESSMIDADILIRSHWLLSRVSLSRGHNVLALEHARTALKYQEDAFGSDSMASWSGSTSLGHWTFGFPDPPLSPEEANKWKGVSYAASKFSFGNVNYSNSNGGLQKRLHAKGHPSMLYTLELIIDITSRMGIPELSLPLIPMFQTLWSRFPCPIVSVSAPIHGKSLESRAFPYISPQVSLHTRAVQTFTCLLKGSDEPFDIPSRLFARQAELDVCRQTDYIQGRIKKQPFQQMIAAEVIKPITPETASIFEHAAANQQLVYASKLRLYSVNLDRVFFADWPLIQAVSSSFTPPPLQGLIGHTIIPRTPTFTPAHSSDLENHPSCTFPESPIQQQRILSSTSVSTGVADYMWSTPTLPGDIQSLCDIGRCGKNPQMLHTATCPCNHSHASDLVEDQKFEGVDRSTLPGFVDCEVGALWGWTSTTSAVPLRTLAADASASSPSVALLVSQPSSFLQTNPPTVPPQSTTDPIPHITELELVARLRDRHSISTPDKWYTHETDSPQRFSALAGGPGGFAAVTSRGQLYLWGPICEAIIDGEQRHPLAWDSHYMFPAHPFAHRLTVAPFNIEQVAVGLGHILLLTSSGQLLTGGANKFGQLGHGDTHPRQQPRLVEAFQGIRITSISASHTASAAIDSLGYVYGFGSNQGGCLGVADNQDRHFPTKSCYPLPMHHVSLGQGYASAVARCGYIYLCGDLRPFAIESAQTGVPTWIPSKERFVASLSMHGTVFFLSANGEIYSMSRGDSKSVVLRGLSSALAEEVNAPTKLAGSLTGVTICGFAGGGETMYAWDTAGRLYTWGVDCPPVNPFPRVLHSYPRSISYGSDNASTPWVIAPSSCPVPPKSSTSNGFLARRIFHSSVDMCLSNQPLNIRPSSRMIPVPCKSLFRMREGIKFDDFIGDPCYKSTSTSQEQAWAVSMLPNEDREYLSAKQVAVYHSGNRAVTVAITGLPKRSRPNYDKSSQPVLLPFMQVYPPTSFPEDPVLIRFYVPQHAQDKISFRRKTSGRTQIDTTYTIAPISEKEAIIVGRVSYTVKEAKERLAKAGISYPSDWEEEGLGEEAKASETKTIIAPQAMAATEIMQVAVPAPKQPGEYWVHYTLWGRRYSYLLTESLTVLPQPTR